MPRLGRLKLAMGGQTAELLGDATVRLAALGRREAAGMVRSLRSFPLLDR